MDKPNNMPPPWSEAPPWAMWRAQDKDGSWWWYGDEPRQGGQIAWHSNIAELATNGTEEYENQNWRDTLQKRPENE